MRALLLLLLAAACGAGGFLLGHRAARRGDGSDVPRVERPRALEDAWRAWFERRPGDVAALLGTVDGARDSRVRDEARLLSALAAGERAELLALAGAPEPLTPSVRAGALRELARGAASAQERRTHLERLARLCPRSWALGGPEGLR